MSECIVCGKRIWNDPVSIQDKGSYHYECAESTGVLLALEVDRDKILRRIEELKRETHELLAKKEKNHDDLGRQLIQIGQVQDELKVLMSQEKSLNRFERRKGFVSGGNP